MNPTPRTQEDTVRAHLTAGKAITTAQAMLVYRISRLSSVIKRLRDAGMDIQTVMKTDEGGAQYGEYRLAAAPEQFKVGSKVQIKPGHGIGLPKWVRKSRDARVVGRIQDVAHVECIRGTRYEVHPLNIKELSHVA